MYIKAESVGEASHTHPVVDDNDSVESPLSEEALAPVAGGGERLKSVVVVKERTDNEKNDDDEEGSTEMETGGGGGGCGNDGEP